MTDFNIFALNDISVTDDRVKEIFRLHGSGSSINWELLKKAKDIALARYPSDSEIILKDYENELYWTKKKLAKKGLLNERSEYIEAYSDHFEEEEDESPWLGREEGL